MRPLRTEDQRVAALLVLFWGLSLRRGEQETWNIWIRVGIIVGLGLPVGGVVWKGVVGSRGCEGPQSEEAWGWDSDELRIGRFLEAQLAGLGSD